MDNIPPKDELPTCFFCLGPASEICSFCKLVSFCSEEHHLIHRPESFCFPIIVRSSDSVGRYVVAARDIQPTEMILYDAPVVLGPKSSSDLVCLQCLKKVDGNYLCSGCGWPVCDEKCQTGKTHSKECKTLQNSDVKHNFSESTEMYRGITPLRLLRNISDDPKLNERLKYLMDHDKERRTDEELWNNHVKFSTFFRENYHLDQYTEDDFNRATGLLWTNAFECCKGGGQALFPTFSLLSHSCLANACHVVFPNNHLVLQAKTLIKAGEEITINYISSIQGKVRRRIKLRDKWFFSCSCFRCVDPTENRSHCSTLICQVNSCAGFVVQEKTENVASDFVCQKCGATTNHLDILKIENQIVKNLQEVSRSNSPELIEKTVLESEAILHSNHYINLIAKRHILTMEKSSIAKMTLEELEMRKTRCQQVLDVLSCIDPGYSTERGSILCQLAETLKFLAKKLFSEQKISEVQFSEMIDESMRNFCEYQKSVILSFKREA